MPKYKKFLLLFAAVLLLSACSANIKSVATEQQQDVSTVKNNESERKVVGAVETEYHFFFEKLYRDEELTENEKKRYEEKGSEILAFLASTAEINEQCVKRVKEINSQFSDKHLGKNSITYADGGVNGVLYNTRLTQAIKSYASCVNENEEKIKEIAIYNKFIYDALLAEYNAGIRVLKLKEADNEICVKAGLGAEQKAICEAVNEGYLISQAEKAYAISPDIKEINKTREEIKEDMDNFANINKQIQELEGLN